MPKCDEGIRIVPSSWLWTPDLPFSYCLILNSVPYCEGPCVHGYRHLGLYFFILNTIISCSSPLHRPRVALLRHSLLWSWWTSKKRAVQSWEADMRLYSSKGFWNFRTHGNIFDLERSHGLWVDTSVCVDLRSDTLETKNNETLAPEL